MSQVLGDKPWVQPQMFDKMNMATIVNQCSLVLSCTYQSIFILDYKVHITINNTKGQYNRN